MRAQAGSVAVKGCPAYPTLLRRWRHAGPWSGVRLTRRAHVSSARDRLAEIAELGGEVESSGFVSTSDGRQFSAASRRSRSSTAAWFDGPFAARSYPRVPPSSLRTSRPAVARSTREAFRSVLGLAADQRGQVRHTPEPLHRAGHDRQRRFMTPALRASTVVGSRPTHKPRGFAG